MKNRDISIFPSKLLLDLKSTQLLPLTSKSEALAETRNKIIMTQRLRVQGEADAVSEVSVKLEGLERIDITE
ncbi:MAG: hypothetical protein PHQ90_11040 [Sulfuricurvum sp.]|uniref:hypothetical protein n=1 Tax=Sulfuricurvum sp. TaxID=2025608 RepID=UPI0026122774|nr:hypothetical protein [Sulfuricurvum sp.]MDD2369829.1 hypothetical protein [Sulfuricurvum sp.]MDD5118691.1 hypothetical protein [Sulfuricurvum sp.]